MRFRYLGVLLFGLCLLGSPPVLAQAHAGNMLTGWQCASIQGQVVACELQLQSLRPPLGAAPLWLPYPLADFAGMEAVAVQRADSLVVLRVMLDIRQMSSIAMAVPGGIALSPAVAQRVGPTLAHALEQWFSADGLTEDLAHGGVPPVPGYGTPPGRGQDCWWQQSGLPHTACNAPSATISATGRILWSRDHPRSPLRHVARILLRLTRAATGAAHHRSRPAVPLVEDGSAGVCHNRNGTLPCVERVVTPSPAEHKHPRLRPWVAAPASLGVLCVVAMAWWWHRR